MSSKVVTLPKHTIDIELAPAQNGRPAVIEQRNTFIHLLGRVAELKKHKNDTDAYLSHAIEEKIKEISRDAKTIELEEAEILFVEEGIKQLRSESSIAGSAWYYLVAPLAGAVHKTKGK